MKKGFGSVKPQGNRAKLISKVGVSADSMKARKEVELGAEEGVLVRSESPQEHEKGKQSNSAGRTLVPLTTNKLEYTQLIVDRISSQDSKNL